MKTRSILVLVVTLVFLGLLVAFFLNRPDGNMQRGDGEANSPPHAIQQ